MLGAALAQPRPYIGFVYPAGGQQGTTFQVRLGGQGWEDVSEVLVSGTGVTAKITENYRRLDGMEMQLLNEQASLLRRKTLSASSHTMLTKLDKEVKLPDTPTNGTSVADETTPAEAQKAAARALLERIEKRTAEYVATPASAAIASLVLVEVSIAADAEPGEREMRLVTSRGVSNPLVFYVGQLPEITEKPMTTAIQQVLGKESSALRKRPPGEDEQVRLTLPCTVNGQIASGEVHRYPFQAHKGERVVISVLGRRLVPFMADAVPGWFQPVLALYDAEGKEVAYDDRYRFKPDPTIFFEAPADGEYVIAIHDSLYRGREDFVYRLTAGDLPFITSAFPLGGPASAPPKPEIKGWNLDGAKLTPPEAGAEPGTHYLRANRKDLVSNRVPFALDTLPELMEQEPNDDVATAQKVNLPVIINGRIGKPDDWDVFQFEGKSNQTVVAEVRARRLDSPLDSVLKLTDATGKLLAFNDDTEDLAAGINTHQADSYLMARLPADGTYYVHIGDTARQGGDEYGYRLRLGAPMPDFELRIVPSSLSIRSNSSAPLTVYVLRQDGFKGPIKLSLKDPPAGFSAPPTTLSATQTVGRLNVKTSLLRTEEPVRLSVLGSAKIGSREVTHEAVPAEDRMQAFLWRQLVPARDLQVLVFDPAYQPPPKRVAPAVPVCLPATNAPAATNLVAKSTPGTNTLGGTNVASVSSNAVPPKPKFSKQQVAYRLRQLKRLYEEGMLSDQFYCEKVAECEAAE